jgi:broad specificity phosphatase PhoE
VTKFLLIRHGSTDMLDIGISGWKPGIALNARGRSEVGALASRLAGRCVAALYASPLERTHETAAILAMAFGLEPVPCAALGELRFGEWTGRTFDMLGSDPCWTRFNTFRSGTRIPEGELMLETQTRSVSAILSFREQHDGRTVALVTHGDVIKSVVAYFLGMPLDFYDRLEISPASLSELELSADHARILKLNETGE